MSDFYNNTQKNGLSNYNSHMPPLYYAFVKRSSSCVCVRCSHVETVEYTSVLSKQNVSV